MIHSHFITKIKSDGPTQSNLIVLRQLFNFISHYIVSKLAWKTGGEKSLAT